MPCVRCACCRPATNALPSVLHSGTFPIPSGHCSWGNAENGAGPHRQVAAAAWRHQVTVVMKVIWNLLLTAFSHVQSGAAGCCTGC